MKDLCGFSLLPPGPCLSWGFLSASLLAGFAASYKSAEGYTLLSLIPRVLLGTAVVLKELACFEGHLCSCISPGFFFSISGSILFVKISVLPHVNKCDRYYVSRV